MIILYFANGSAIQEIFEPITLAIPGLCIMINLGGEFLVCAKISDQSEDGRLLSRKGTVFSADPGVPSIVGSVTSSTMTPTILCGSVVEDSFVCGFGKRLTRWPRLHPANVQCKLEATWRARR